MFVAMPKYKTSMTSNISPELFAIHSRRHTVTEQRFQLTLDLLLNLLNGKDDATKSCRDFC